MDCGLFVLPFHCEGHPKALLETMTVGVRAYAVENATLERVVER